jgi:S-adenosylmethionine hydrolase
LLPLESAVALILYTDFGANDLYVGQVEAVLDRIAPGVRVIHLLHEAPSFNVLASAHLLAALAPALGREHVFLGVVDPGVGTDRPAVIARIDDNWYVGPDNGLFSVLATRAATRSVWRIVGAPRTAEQCLRPQDVGATRERRTRAVEIRGDARLLGHIPTESGAPVPRSGAPVDASVSFHGRDIFAPLAAAIAIGRFPEERVVPASELAVQLDAADLAEVIYVDHYGNAFTGLRAHGVSPDRTLVVNGHSTVPHARVFAEMPPGVPFWYANASALIEIAMNRGSAAAVLGLQVGAQIAWKD